MLTPDAVLSRYSSTLIARGLIAIAFAIVTFLWPGPAIGALAVLFGAYAFVDGIGGIVAGLERIGDPKWWASFLTGIIGVIAGIVAFMLPGITIEAFVWMIAIWAIARGVLDLIVARWLRRMAEGEWMLALAGVLSIVFGLLLFTYPTAGAIYVVWWVALYALFFGIVLVSCGIRLRQHARLTT
jgi:uncharacterized membrane protein HdeD (DUF308 family)